MPTPKITVVTDVGTFTRSTNRIYSHIVVVGPHRAEYAEAERRQSLHIWGLWLTQYHAELEGTSHTTRTKADTQARINETKANIAEALRRGPITTDEGAPAVWGWCGRLDLARGVARNVPAHVFTWVRIYALDGTRVQ